MKVMLATPAFLPTTGGAERSADRVARGLAARGHEVTVLTKRRPGHEDPPAPYAVVRYGRPRHRKRFPFVEGFTIRRLQRELATEVTLAFYAWPMGQAAAVSRRFLGGPPLVACPRGFDLYPDWLAANPPRKRRAVARGYAWADRLIAISGSLEARARSVVEASGRRLPPVDRVPNGVDAATLSAEAEASTHPLDGRPYALVLARLEPVKAHAVAVEALASSAEELRGLQARVVFAGGGGETARLHSLAEEHGVADLLVFAGEVHGAAKAAWLAHAAVGLSCSREEGLPNAVLEQLAVGRPVLLSAIGPHAEIRDADPAGPRAVTLFPTDDPQTLAPALVAALREPGASEPASRLAACFSVERMIDGYEASLRAALEGA